MSLKECSYCNAHLFESKICSRCKKTSYCNKICQIKHWKSSHKSSCCDPSFYLFEDSLDDENKFHRKKSNQTFDAFECRNCGSPKAPLLCSRCKLVNYCSDSCQKQHWKSEGGHKKFCVSEKERKTGNFLITERKRESNLYQLIECAICLEVVTCSTTCLLPCAHIFHIQCIKELRIMGVVQACPICRMQLPDKEISIDASQRAVHLNLMNQQHPLPCAQWKEIDEATTMLRIAADLGCPDSSRNLSVILNELGDTTGAEAACRRALEIEPTFVDAWISLGKVLESKGDIAGSLLSFRNALKINPLKTLALFNIGVLLKNTGNLADAEVAYRRALEIDPLYADASRNLATVLCAMGDLSGAETAYRRTIEIDPDHDAHFGLGNVLMGKGDYAGAEAAFRTALAIDPMYASVLLNLSHCLRYKGDFAGADIAYRKAIDIDPMIASA